MADWRMIEDDREKYQAYLCSREWGVLKEAVHKRAKGLCERCRAFPIDAVHHLTYERKYREKLEDLQGICKHCHEFTHGKSDFDPVSEQDGLIARYFGLCLEIKRRPFPFELRERNFVPTPDTAFVFSAVEGLANLVRLWWRVNKDRPVPVGLREGIQSLQDFLGFDYFNFSLGWVNGTSKPRYKEIFSLCGFAALAPEELTKLGEIRAEAGQ